MHKPQFTTAGEHCILDYLSVVDSAYHFRVTREKWKAAFLCSQVLFYSAVPWWNINYIYQNRI